MFYNRLKKRFKHLKKWSKRLGIHAYRLYDRDIPEIPAAVDVYIEDTTDRLFAVLTEYAPSSPKQNTGLLPFQELKTSVCQALDIPEESVYGRCRRRQRGDSQYEKITDMGKRIIVREGKCRFLINLSGYLDTGLFLDHRPTRLFLAENAFGKIVLNLFCYTASFSIHTLAGGAREVCSVDLSKKYLQWAQENVRLNGLDDPARCRFVHRDVRSFLKEAAQHRKRWDIIICDPPTFSNSKRAPDFLDINRHWPQLIQSCCTVLSPDGTLYFSTNSRTLRFSTAALSDQPIQDMDAGRFFHRNTVFKADNITDQSIPEDFRNKKIHRLWKITRETAGEAL
ncbi:MAG: class I SAM-dependent methyltransferase [Treponema sp.]